MKRFFAILGLVVFSAVAAVIAYIVAASFFSTILAFAVWSFEPIIYSLLFWKEAPNAAILVIKAISIFVAMGAASAVFHE